MALDMEGNYAVQMMAILIPIVGSVALFSFLGLASWSEARRKEREAYYTTEALKKIAESSGESAKSALEYLQERNQNIARKRIEGLKLGGLITAAVGIGLMVFLRAVATEADDRGVYLLGVIPLLIGVALMIYSFVLVPKEQS